MKKKIKNFYLLLFLVLGMFAFTASAGAESSDEEDDSISSSSPLLVIGWNSTVQEFSYGESKHLTIPILNDGNGNAYHGYISINVSDPNNFPFLLDNLKLMHPLTTIDAHQSITVDFGTVIVSPGAKSQIYDLTVNLEYEDSTGIRNTQSAPIRIKINNENSQPKLTFTGVQLSNQEGIMLDAGTSALIHLCMKNEGKSAARNVRLKLGGFSQESVNLAQNMDTWRCDTIEQGELFLVPFQLSLNKNMLKGTYALNLEMKYEDEQQNELTDTACVYLLVNGKEEKEEKEETKATPRLIISNYAFGHSYIKAGEAFTLNMVFTNTSEESLIQNIKVSVSSDSNVMSPVGSSNTFVIPQIAKNSSLEQAIVLQPMIDADTKTYNVNVAMEYQDEDGGGFTAQETIGIPVVQEIRFTLSEMQLPEECYLDSQVEVSVDYYNMGRTGLRNLMITTEGDFEISNGDLYVGNLDAGKSDYFDVTVIPHESGKHSGVIRFTFEDAIGNCYQQEKPFTLSVMENPMGMDAGMNDMYDMDTMPEEENNFLRWGLIGGGAVVVVGIGGGLIRRHIRRKREEIEIDE